jgi:hypothetical protein
MSNAVLILNFLNQQHFQSYFTPIAKILKSVEAAILFSELVQRYQYHETREELLEIPNKGNGWFYHTKENIEDRTAINRYNQDKAVEALKKFSLIETVQHGMPCKRYIRLNLQGIEEFSKNISRKSTFDRQGSRPSTDREVDLRPTDSLYIEEPNKEPKEEKPSPASSKKKQPRKDGTIPFGQYVLLRDGEYEILCNEIGKPYVDYYILAINNYVPNHEPYKDYAATVRAWHLRDKANGKMPNVQKVHETTPISTSPDRCGKNKYLAELAEKKLSHLFSSHVYFQASRTNGLLVNLNKDIKKEIDYSSYDTPKFKEVLIRELESCFPNVRAILMGNTDNKVSNIITNLASKFKTTEVTE